MKKLFLGFSLLLTPMTAYTDINVTEGSGKVVGSDTVGGKEYQKIKLLDGTAGSTTAAEVTAGNALKVDGSAVTQPVSISGTLTTNAAIVNVATTTVTGTITTSPIYTQKYEYSGSSLTYQGLAAPGTSTSSNAWRIMKFSYSGSNPTDIQFASGTASFIHQWDLRATYTYQ